VRCPHLIPIQLLWQLHCRARCAGVAKRRHPCRLRPGGKQVSRQAIARNAWTFAGSGTFRILSRRPLVFGIAGNPVVRGEVAARPICDWHVAVFERLFADLVDPDVTVTETACCACGAPECRFVLHLP
jgi:bacteriochlorophyll 4-vinyl reductase